MIDILLVDDETYVTESLAKTIPWKEIGIERVFQAASSAEALEVLEAENVDIVVTDIRMPGMDGLKLIESIGTRWPNIRCILLTGYTDFQYAKKAIQLQAVDYLLKPVGDGEFMDRISHVVESLKDEWAQSEKYHQLVYKMKSDAGVLKTILMHDLLLGRRLSHKAVKEKMDLHDIPLEVDESTVLLLIQLGKPFAGMDPHSFSLFEFAVGNIAEEVMSGDFRVWHGKAPHECLVVLAQLKTDGKGRAEEEAHSEKRLRAKLDRAVAELRRNVSNYLKGDVSIVVTKWFHFPDEIPSAYRAGMSGSFLIGHAEGREAVFLEDRQGDGKAAFKSIDSLYKPPTLIHLLESKQWKAAESKIEEVFKDIAGDGFSKEHLYEVYLSVTNAFMYVAHKHGLYMHQLDLGGSNPLVDQTVLFSLEKLRIWSIGLLDKLKEELSENDQHTRSFIVKQVQEIVSRELGQDISVKTIADRVFLHPVYLSKIYKAVTGESLGDYIIRMRMEQAHYLLKNSNKKIYEITQELGYQNPQYFSRMFKKYYGVTPHEFREL